MSSASPALLVGQSGGATAVINASLVGVVEAALESGSWPRIIGACNGIEGLLRDRLVDLGALDRGRLAGVRRTPSAALGTGRYKMKDGDIDLALARMAELGITAFVYIGGNDSADTADRLARRAAETGQALRVAAVPKTIDNDLPVTDHCPGYGSIARYLGNAVRDATYDSIASPQLYPVKFVEVMGRDAGWVAASGALGFDADEADLLPMILLPERPQIDTSEILTAIHADLDRRGWTVVVVPETIRLADGHHPGGDEPDYVDEFGHPYYPSAGSALTRAVTLQLGHRARYEKPGTAARMSIALASEVDLEEAYALGVGAVERIAGGESGIVTILRRVSNDPYRCEVDAVPIGEIANQVRRLPEDFIAANGRSITDAFREYAMPLLGPDPFPPYTRIG